jgi:hypothetical protein
LSPTSNRGKLQTIAMPLFVLVFTLLLSAQAQQPSANIVPWPAPATLSGVIVDESGQPLPGVEARLFAHKLYLGQSTFWPRASATTNERGEFTIPDIYPDSYHFIVLPNQPATAAVPARAMVPTFHPGVVQFSQAAPLKFSPGQHVTGLRMTVRTQPVFQVSGTLSRTGGAAGDHSVVTIALYPEDSPFRSFGPGSVPGTMTTPETYRFFGVPPGRYRIVAGSGRNPGATFIGSFRAEVKDANVEAPPFALTPTPELSGRFLFEGATPGSFDWSQFKIQPRDLAPGFGWYTTQTRPDGTFHQRVNAPGEVKLAIEGPLPPRAYLSAIRASRRDLLGQAIDPMTLPTEDLQFVIRTDSGSLIGSVAEPSAGHQFSVMLVPVEHRLRGVASRTFTIPGPPYHFQFDTVRPGDYLLLAVERQRFRDLNDDRFFTPDLERSAQRVHVGPNETQDVSLKLSLAPVAK